MILKNIRYLITQNASRDIYEDIDLKIIYDEIAAIGRNLNSENEQVIDCRNKIVMPGVINAHTHSSMTLLRGISDNKELQEWLNDDIFPAENNMEPYHIYVGSLLACYEMLSTGTTTFNDMYAEMDRVGKAVEETGIRAVLGRGLMDVDGDGEEALNDAVELVKEFENHERIDTCISPHAIYTVSEQLLRESKDVAEIFDKQYHIHLSETKKEVQDSIDNHGMTPLEYLDHLGLINDSLIGAHGVHLTETEKIILEENGGSIVHNPSANLKLGSGVADIPDLIDRKINVAIGTDGPASNNNLNMFEEAKITSILHKVETPEDVSEQQVMDMITINGAKALGMEDKIGSVDIGKKADLITINLNNPEMRPIHGQEGLISNIIYSFSGNVDDVILGGEILIKDKEFKRGNNRLIGLIDDLAEDLTN